MDKWIIYSPFDNVNKDVELTNKIEQELLINAMMMCIMMN